MRSFVFFIEDILESGSTTPESDSNDDDSDIENDSEELMLSVMLMDD